MHENSTSGVPPPVEKVVVDAAVLAKLKDEQDYTGLAVELMIEVASHVCLAACALPADRKEWNRNEAVLGGLLVRSYKLLDSLLDHTCKHRAEISFVLIRLILECAINIQYLIRNGSDELYDAFVASSLRLEKRMKTAIEKNIAKRSGIVLPIEARMLSSIARAFEKSGIRSEQVTKESIALWKNVTFETRCRVVDFEAAYLFGFASASHAVHGNWQDLLMHHLDVTATGFTPDTDWHPTRPQLLLGTAKVVLQMLTEYMRHLLNDNASEIHNQYEELYGRIRKVDEAHENYLASRQKAR